MSKSTDGTIVVWDAVSGNPERRFKVKGPSDSASLFDISTDGRFLVAGNAQGTLFVWNVQVRYCYSLCTICVNVHTYLICLF